MAQIVDRPVAAFVLSLIGGIIILLVGLLIGLIGFIVTVPLGGIGAVIGVLGLAWGIIIIIGAALLYSRPEQHTAWGVIILVFSIVSWYGTLGGFFIGFILALIGGILAITWKPTIYAQQSQGGSFPPVQ